MNSLSNKYRLKYLAGIGVLLCIIVLLYTSSEGIQDSVVFSPPTMHHWFGTDVIGNDVFLKSLNALFIALFTLAIVLPAIYLGGLIIGCVLSYFDNEKVREFFLNLVHYWVTLPVLLIAVFLLILIGAGQVNVIGI